MTQARRQITLLRLEGCGGQDEVRGQRNKGREFKAEESDLYLFSVLGLLEIGR